MRDAARAGPGRGADASTRCGPALRSLPTAGAKPLTRQLQRPGQHRSHAGVEQCAYAPAPPPRASPAACWEMEFARRHPEARAPHAAERRVCLQRSGRPRSGLRHGALHGLSRQSFFSPCSFTRAAVMGGLVQPVSCDQALPTYPCLVRHAQHRQTEQYSCWPMVHTERDTPLLIFGTNMRLHLREVLGWEKSWFGFVPQQFIITVQKPTRAFSDALGRTLPFPQWGS